MKKQKRKFSAAFKLKVVLDALSERSTIAELGLKYQLHSNLINNWKREFLSKAYLVFEGKHAPGSSDSEAEKQRLYAKIGELEMENDFLRKASSMLQR
jgi:transposase